MVSEMIFHERECSMSIPYSSLCDFHQSLRMWVLILGVCGIPLEYARHCVLHNEVDVDNYKSRGRSVGMNNIGMVSFFRKIQLLC